jgi:23S rRNA (pseudouridine1915-N3)-methyltransferase
VKIRVFWFGRSGAAAWDEQVETYRKLVHHRWPAEDRALKPVAGGRDLDPGRVLREEARSLDRVLDQGWPLLALDEGGARLSSVGLADLLGELEERGTPGLDFVIGSDLGLDPELRKRATHRLSLSPMTLPHRIARLVLWEQIFRATHILAGGAYHRPGIR